MRYSLWGRKEVADRAKKVVYSVVIADALLAVRGESEKIKRKGV